MKGNQVLSVNRLGRTKEARRAACPSAFLGLPSAPARSCVLSGLALTWPPVPLFHPDVTVALGHSSLGVEEGQAHAAFGAQAGVVIVALFHGISVVLLPQAVGGQEGLQGKAQKAVWDPFDLSVPSSTLEDTSLAKSNVTRRNQAGPQRPLGVLAGKAQNINHLKPHTMI